MPDPTAESAARGPDELREALRALTMAVATLITVRDRGAMDAAYRGMVIASIKIGEGAIELLRPFAALRTPSAPSACDWIFEADDGGYWETACGHAFVLNAGSPAENDMGFCPYCGRVLATLQSPATQPSEEE